jgi:orotidine-5'-phosphate decarboxylase
MTTTDDHASAPPPAEARAHIAVALDVDDLVVAMRLARDLRPYVGVAKVGLELYSAVGPEAIGGLAELGYDVFCDLKLHDIPNTVHRASRVIGALGARYLNVHTSGGVDMVRAGVEGLAEGAADAGLPDPTMLGVTVLTSDTEASEAMVTTRLRIAMEAGCGGVVCGAPDLPIVRSIGPRLVTVVPGIRPEGADLDDQSRVATPRVALDAGADILVIGRPITRADDPIAAAASILESLG